MPRNHARVNVTIWGDPDWRRLPPAAQHLYLTLWTSPNLAYCGVHDWRPARITGLTEGWGADHVRTVAQCLQSRHFLVIDDDTEEVFIRSWIRWDGLMREPRMAISCITAYAAVASPTIRKALVHELTRERDRNPNLPCWNDKRVLEVLEHEALSAKDLPPVFDPFGDGFGDGFGLGLPQTRDGVSGSVSTPPTPSPTPTPNSFSPDASASRRSPERPLPDDWRPNDVHAAYATEHRIDMDREVFKFRNHAAANDRRQRNWNAAFTTWLAKARDFTPAQKADKSHLPEAWR